MRHYLRVWRVSWMFSPADDVDEERDEPPEVIFAGRRAADAFARELHRRGAAWVVGPWESSIYRTAKAAVELEFQGTES